MKLVIKNLTKTYKNGVKAIDNLSLEIRNKRIKRKDAISIIKKDNFKTPKEDIKKFCSFVGMTEDKFFKICENFRNKKIWIKKKNRWVLKVPLK